MEPKKPAPKSTSLTFPKQLLIPPKSQLELQQDAIAARIGEFDEYALKLGSGFGVAYTPGFELNKARRRATANGEAAVANPSAENALLFSVAALLGSVLLPSQLVSLERREGRWGLFYTPSPGGMATTGGAASTTVPLKDAPLAMRQEFLLRSEEFFRGYLALCEERLGTLSAATEAADRTLALLRTLAAV